MLEEAGELRASVEAYLAGDGATQERSEALIRELSLLFGLTADAAGAEDLSRYDEIFLKLAEQVDSESRGFLSVQLSVVVNAPRRTVR
ncbi:hypothetical protein, partial [Mycobacterium tuberculosis]|uniref:hypothetical protein n=1 Tax=Mycobacterium tuberculosis TaxID=1773 RepID=UPI001AE3EBA3